MKNKKLRLMNLICVGTILAVLASPWTQQAMTVYATSIKEVQNQIKNTQNELNNINDKIETLSDEQDLVEEKIADLNAEILNTMTSIGMKEDEIAAKEVEIADKQVKIAETEKEYEAAKARETEQYEAMIQQIRFMYENGNSTYLGLLLEGQGFADALNRIDYAQEIYDYDRTKLEEYEATKQQVCDLWNQLEAEKMQLEADKTSLEETRESLKAQKENLDVMLAQKKEESANYEAEINKARQEASVAKTLLQQEQAQLKKLQEEQRKAKQLEEERRKAAQLAAAQQNSKDLSVVSSGNKNSSTSAAVTASSTTSNNSSSSTTSTSNKSSSTGSALGQEIANYACQFVGNPYVMGGTSLTKGADCSGFTYRVYSDYGYSIPRTSYEQRSAGVGVSYSEAQPGDLICYSGHVAMYIGDGKIVHASTAKTGIKISNAQYRTILAVRRII